MNAEVTKNVWLGRSNLGCATSTKFRFKLLSSTVGKNKSTFCNSVRTAKVVRGGDRKKQLHFGAATWFNQPKNTSRMNRFHSFQSRSGLALDHSLRPRGRCAHRSTHAHQIVRGGPW